MKVEQGSAMPVPTWQPGAEPLLTAVGSGKGLKFFVPWFHHLCNGSMITPVWNTNELRCMTHMPDHGEIKYLLSGDESLFNFLLGRSTHCWWVYKMPLTVKGVSSSELFRYGKTRALKLIRLGYFLVMTFHQRKWLFFWIFIYVGFPFQ